MATKLCKSDPIPTSLLKQILPAVIPTITKIMNMSLRDGVFASKLEDCYCQVPFEKNCYSQSVSNLPFLAKALERCALAQLDEHCKANGPIPDYQSAYREHYTC